MLLTIQLVVKAILGAFDIKPVESGHLDKGINDRSVNRYMKYYLYNYHSTVISMEIAVCKNLLLNEK